MEDKNTKGSSEKTVKERKIDYKKKIGEMKKVLMKERNRADDYLNKLKYLQAEFENYRKRVKKEIEESIRYENEKLILKFIGIFDELELAAEAGKKSQSGKVLIDGIDMVIDKFREIFEKEGLCQIEAIGKPFDPNLHEAVAQVQTEKQPEGTIIEELKKGYKLDGKVIRPSFVSVAKGKKEEK